MKRRPKGTGTIERMADGRYRGRMPNRGHRLEPCDTEEQAGALLDAVLLTISLGAAPPGGATLRSWGASCLELRELQNHADISSDISRWKTHVIPSPFIDWPLDTITAPDIREWLDKMLVKKAAKGKGHKSAPRRTISRSMVRNTFYLLRAFLQAAVDRGRLAANAAASVELPEDEGRTHDPWTYLPPEEQSDCLADQRMGEADRDLVAFAMGTGLRQGEQWNLELVDVRDGLAIVRYGKRKGTTKGKRIRRVPLFGMAAAAVARQLERLKKQPNPHKLLWPLPSGERRQKGEPDFWREVRPSGEGRHDGRHVRWHDLRHTCASSLVAGWWGRAWTLREVQALLGHRSITTTERYAHLADTALEAAARATDNPTIVPEPQGSDMAKLLKSLESHLRDLNSRPTVYENPAVPNDSREIEELRGTVVGLSERAVEAMAAMAAGSPQAWPLAERALAALGELGRGLRAVPAAESGVA